MLILGIDPGMKGAIAILDSHGVILVKEAMPVIGKVFDLRTLITRLKALDTKKYRVFIEDVHAMYGSAAGATFAFGRVCGYIEAIVATCGFSYILVQPKAWQKVMYQGVPEMRRPPIKITKGKRAGQTMKGKLETKKMSLVAAKRLFPDADLRRNDRCQIAHDGIVDALLIAEYGRKTKYGK